MSERDNKDRTVMSAYFIRMTEKINVRDEDLHKLWAENVIVIHYPGPQVLVGAPDSESLDPNDYADDRLASSVIRRFVELGQNGGYVWAECRSRDEVKVGVVNPGTKVSLRDAVSWGRGRDGQPAKLKGLALTNVVEIKPGERLALRAGRPQQGTLGRWRAADEVLPAIIDGRALALSWASLYPTLQEVACAEYLRHAKDPVPRLCHLLMPVGRTMKDVDIYGLCEDGKEILAQVTYSTETSNRASEKLRLLQPYLTSGAHVVLFCRRSGVEHRDGILLVSVDTVFEWLKLHSTLLETFLSM
jgi:hypothetical protein